MKLLESKKLKLPQVYLIEDKSEIKNIPIGIPFILSNPNMEKYLIRILEYEVIYQNAIKLGYPFNFKKILLERGYTDITDFSYQNTVYMDYVTEDMLSSEDLEFEIHAISNGKGVDLLKDYIKDSSCYVDITKLKNLNVFPVWLDKIEEAISTNIHNFATFDNNIYNKKLEGMYGGLSLTSPNKNLIVIDISASIPKAVGTTCLTLSKNLAESFYADILITGRETILFEYENLGNFDPTTAYDLYGNSNESIMYRALVTNSVKHYETAIVFGDNHSPCDSWSSEKRISREDAQKLCKWKVNKLISFHTTSSTEIAGYADFFSPTETENIKDWVKYLN